MRVCLLAQIANSEGIPSLFARRKKLQMRIKALKRAWPNLLSLIVSLVTKWYTVHDVTAVIINGCTERENHTAHDGSFFCSIRWSTGWGTHKWMNAQTSRMGCWNIWSQLCIVRLWVKPDSAWYLSVPCRLCVYIKIESLSVRYWGRSFVVGDQLNRQQKTPNLQSLFSIGCM